MSDADRASGRAGAVRSSQDLAAGIFLVLVAAFALWQGANLTAGHLGQIGPGLFPRALAVLTGLIGLGIALGAFRFPGERLGGVAIRGPLFVIGAVVVFGLTVRPLGLLVAGPLAFLIGALASPETRWHEALICAAGLTTFCYLLFILALGLPIPVAPWALGR